MNTFLSKHPKKNLFSSTTQLYGQVGGISRNSVDPRPSIHQHGIHFCALLELLFIAEPLDRVQKNAAKCLVIELSCLY